MYAHLQLQKILRAKLGEAQTRNPSYSIRSFAKRIGIAPSTLSMILSGQRSVSRKTAEKIAVRLPLDPVERAAVLEKFSETKKEEQKDGSSFHHSLKISADQYIAFSEWHYMAILNLMRLKTFKPDASWISKRIGIPRLTVIETLERLLRLGMISKAEDGTLARTAPSYRTSDDVMNTSLRKAHFQHIELLREKLEETTLHERDFSWVTFSFKKERMKEAKEAIRRFEADFTETFTRGEDNDEVYRLSVQMIPLTQTDNERCA